MQTPTSDFNQRDFWRTWVVAHFEERRRKNPSYSLRAFAKSLSVSPTALSQALSQQRCFSRKNCLRIAGALGLSDKDANSFLNVNGHKTDLKREESCFFQLSDDAFQMISDWYYFAVMNLCDLENIPNDPVYHAERLGIEVCQATMAIERLLRLGLIAEANGFLTRTSQSMPRTTRDIPSEHIRKYHHQVLDLAQRRLEEVPVAERDFSAITFAANRELLPEIKEMILNFKRELARRMGIGTRDSVYTISIQLFPNTLNREKQA